MVIRVIFGVILFALAVYGGYCFTTDTVARFHVRAIERTLDGRMKPCKCGAERGTVGTNGDKFIILCPECGRVIIDDNLTKAISRWNEEEGEQHGTSDC